MMIMMTVMRSGWEVNERRAAFFTAYSYSLHSQPRPPSVFSQRVSLCNTNKRTNEFVVDDDGDDDNDAHWLGVQ